MATESAPQNQAVPRRRNPARRRAILDAADAVIQRDGPDASMSAIAAEAGISKPILYRHFGDKSGLYRSLAERHVDPLVDRVRSELYGDDGLERRTRATVGVYLQMIRRNLNLYRFLMDRATAEDPGTRGHLGLMVRRMAEDLAETLVDRGYYDDHVRAQIVAHGVVGMVQAAGEWWLGHPEVAAEDVLEDLVAAVVGAIKGQRPAAPG
ncbi:AcrR family transcriptional regulator [Lipingzhangella halophila]|uniref:AcrR family transcriptional regulator n=1 Tax=Lipingzhangella halophila TaxID=1783352 RepID=A0A7W7W388_9ACTN|nr:TetR family transcriptional regulator [Lipingzhangella halophila]MBB4931485.1 AcrR family transcriptional regulator [Lipingzhangella halophila]